VRAATSCCPQNTETDRLTLTISTLEYTLARTAQGLGLPDGQALSEHLQLKDRSAAQEQDLHRKEDTISALMDDLAAADARGQRAAALQQQVAELQQAVQGLQQAAAEAASDKNTLLDYVQVSSRAGSSSRGCAPGLLPVVHECRTSGRCPWGWLHSTALSTAICQCACHLPVAAFPDSTMTVLPSTDCIACLLHADVKASRVL
jgi:hypothetical protein